MVVPIPYPLMMGGYSSENSISTYGPFSAIVRSLVVLNRSDGSVINAFFFDRTDTEGFDLALVKERFIPVGN